MRVTVAVLVSALCLVLTSGCGAPSEPDPGAPPSSRETTSDGSGASSPADGGIDASYSVGDYELHLACVGAASPERPTIVYLHGLGGDGGDVNEALAPELAERGRLCTYDRVNVGLSGREDSRHTGTDSVRDLHRLLTVADVPPPYHLVGFSFGGLIGLMYAGTYPEDVEGLLLIDSSLPTDAQVDALIPAGMRAQVIQEQQANGERVDFYAALEEAAALVDSVPDVPITYLAARPVELPPEWPVQRMRVLISANQRDLVDKFRQGRLVPVRSSHDIDLERPELVIDEFDRMLGR